MHDGRGVSGPVSDLVMRARNDEKEAWEALVDRYASLISSICRQHGLGHDDAEDVRQSVWLQLVGHLGGLREPAALPGWLVTTARRECVRVLHAGSPLAAGYVLNADTLPDDQAETVERVEREVLAAERRAALRKAFGDLPQLGQQLMLMLLEDPPVPYAEISARLGICIGSIGPYRSRYLNRIRRHPAIVALAGAEAATG